MARQTDQRRTRHQRRRSSRPIAAKTNFAQFPFLPSYWLSAGVLRWAEGILAMAGFFVLVLLSHVLFFGFFAFTRLGNLYYEAANQAHSRASVWGQWLD